MKDFRHQFIGCFHWRFIHIGTESRLFDGFLWQKVTPLIADIHLSVHRQTHTQRMLLHVMWVKRDAYRQALDDFDPVAAGVLGWQQ